MKGWPFSRLILPSLNLPTRIFGPCRSHMIATVRPALAESSFTSAARFWWSCAVPCEKLRRTTSIPARIMRSRIAGSLDAGPRVATIFVLRSIRPNLIGSCGDVQHQLALAAAVPVLPKVDALPGAEREPPRDDRDGERGVRERRLDVCRHVVGSLGIVLVKGIALGHQPVQPALEILLRRRIGVLLDHQARRGVPHEHGAEAF